MPAPYRVVSPLPSLAGLERFLAEDAAGATAWIFQATDRAPEADDRMLAAAALCSKPQLDLVQVLDSGRDPSGRAWVATAPLIGTPLGKDPLDPAAAVRAVARVAEALDLVGPLGLFPAVPPDAVLVVDGNVQLIGFSPLAPPRTGRDQCRAIGAILDAIVAKEGRRDDVAEVLRRCADGPDAFAQPAELAAALHVLVGGDTRPSNRAGMATAPSAAQPSRAGEVIGSYQLVSRLGEGGMGDVYLARHTRLGREVALKLLKPALASDADVVRRFFQEARVVNEINHPHIVEVIDFVEEQPHVFCVMELLKGATLGDLAFASPLNLRRIAYLVQQTCDALHAAHTHGVVHRDVKPANIFVTERDGQRDFVKLLDFGVARLAKTAAPHRTQVGLVIGTPAYMSPEQAQGRPVDARADIYAVGAVLFELLSGQTLSTAARPTLPNATPAGEQIPGALADLVMRCIAMEPTQRPASALEIGQALGRVLDPPKPTTTLQTMVAAGLAPGEQKAQRRPPWALLAVGAALVAVGGFFVFGPKAAPVVPPSPPPVVAVVDAGPAPVVEAPVVPDAGAILAALSPAAPVEPAPPPVVEPGKKKKGKKHGGGPGAPAKAQADLTRRMGALTRLYGKLVEVHGANSLTRLEKERFNESRADFEADNFEGLATSLPDAEQALKLASDRLGR